MSQRLAEETASGEVRRLLLGIRVLLVGFVVGLVVSGVTAFPLQWELEVGVRVLGVEGMSVGELEAAGRYGAAWVVRVREGVRETGARYPFMAYGTDWLAFAHLVIAAAFVGPLRDPVRHKFVIQWGVFCCAAIIPLALIAGPVRGIPLWWRLIDCSFGVVGVVPLVLVLRWVQRLEKIKI